jgi:hypothetical protein
MKETFQKLKKSHLRIQSTALTALQKTTKATLIMNFADKR